MGPQFGNMRLNAAFYVFLKKDHLAHLAKELAQAQGELQGVKVFLDNDP